MAQAPQTFRNHVRLDPLFHFFLAPASLAMLILAVVNLFRNLTLPAGVQVLATVWAFVATFKIRIYALKVQDRVIRLEEQLRMKALLTPELQARIPEFSESQLVGLRFASDAEVPELAVKTLNEKWNSKRIKTAIRNWRGDYFRV